MSSVAARSALSVPRATSVVDDGRGQHIVLRRLRKTFESRDGTRVTALDDISLDVAAGSFISVVGPTGCGKTTLLRIIAGLTRYSDGDVLVRGERVARPCRDVGIVFQNPVLLPWQNVLQNVTLPARIMRLDKSEALRRATELLALVGLTGYGSKYPQELSGGMQQRVALVRALMHDPPILLLDEPFGALDAMTREAMNVELAAICATRGKTAFLITHSIPEAVFLSDRVLVLSPRPGRLLMTVDVNVPRPRPIEFMGTPRFGELTTEIRRRLGAFSTREQ